MTRLVSCYLGYLATWVAEAIWEGRLLHAYLLKGVCDFTFKSLALWEFLFLFVVFFPFQMSFVNGDRIGVHCRTEQEWEQRQCVDLWRWSEWEFTAQSIEDCFAFRCLGFFSNYHHLSTYHQSVAFGFSCLLSFVISSSYDKTLVLIIYLCRCLISILATDNFVSMMSACIPIRLSCCTCIPILPLFHDLLHYSICSKVIGYIVTWKSFYTFYRFVLLALAVYYILSNWDTSCSM